VNAAFATVLRIRERARQQTARQLAEADRVRDEQRTRVEAIVGSFIEGRAATNPADPAELAAWHGWRLRQEIALRREEARLGQREREAEAARNRHVGRVRDELAVSGVIAARAEEEALDARRADDREMDDVAGRRAR
jgi:hypothetical protein